MKLFRPNRLAAFTAILAVAGSADAQSTNCMAMGPNMVQCYGSDGSSTNCMAMGPNMANCNTTGGQDQSRNQQADSGSGGGFLDYIFGAGFQEASLRKKLGKMIAAGDCQGAAQLAYKKGRLELGSQIAQACSATRGR